MTATESISLTVILTVSVFLLCVYLGATWKAITSKPDEQEEFTGGEHE